MEYRTISRTNTEVSTVGIGSGSVHEAGEKGTMELLDFAQEQGVTLIDVALSHPQPLDYYGAALKGRRDKFKLQMHLGMTFESGAYARDYTRDSIQRSFEDQLRRMGTDYADIALFHCIDAGKDADTIFEGGAFAYALNLKRQGVIRNLGVATHTLDIANRFIETGEVEVFMFSVNAAYDLDPAAHDPYGTDSKKQPGIQVSQDRQRLYQECARQGIGIHVMKAYGGGKLLEDKTSPFGRAMSIPQCLQYALDRPAVLSCVAGVRGKQDLVDAAKLYTTPEEELDYSFIARLQPKELMGSCVYCGHCMPCPAGIDIPLVNKFADLYGAGDEMAKEHYFALQNNATDCIQCGVCESRCPFAVQVVEKMAETRRSMGDTY